MNTYLRNLAFIVVAALGSQPVIFYAHEAQQHQQPLMPKKQPKTLEIQSQQELQTKVAGQTEPSTTKNVMLSICKWVGIACAVLVGIIGLIAVLIVSGNLLGNLLMGYLFTH